MAIATRATGHDTEPIRTGCPGCGQPILAVMIPAAPERNRGKPELVIANPYEWEARTRCYVCANNAARVGERCGRCRGKGHLGGVGRTGGPTGRSERALRGEEPIVCPACSGLGVVGAMRRADCSRCGGDGYVGESRPKTTMLAIDVAWSDDGHVRLIGPSTPRRKGEALYALHECDRAVIIPTPEPRRREVAVA